MIDFNKPVQTRDGRKVRIICTDRKHPHSVVGLIHEEPEREKLWSWSRCGSAPFGYSNQHDLVNTPEKRYVIYLRDMGKMLVPTFLTREGAEAHAHRGRFLPREYEIIEIEV